MTNQGIIEFDLFYFLSLFFFLDIKSSITITYMEHFDELNFSVISCELINFENVSVNMKGSVLIGSFEVLILPENTFGLNGLTIKGFDVKNDESWYEVNFHFNCKPSKFKLFI